MCSPVHLLMLPVCEKLAQVTPRGPVAHRSIASCGAVSCEVSMSHYALADGAKGLHFSDDFSYYSGE